MPTAAEIRAAIAARKADKEATKEASSEIKEEEGFAYKVEPSSIFVDPEQLLLALAWWIKHPKFPEEIATTFIHFVGGHFITYAAKRANATWLVKYLPAPIYADDFYRIARMLWWVEMHLPKELHQELETLLNKDIS